MQDDDIRRQKRREKIRKKKRLKLMFYGAVAVILVIIIVIIIAVSAGGGKKTSDGDLASVGPQVPGEDATVAPLLLDYDYTKPVPETAEVDDSYFSNALFVGDARLQCFELYSFLGSADILSGSGVSVSNIMNYEFGYNGGVTTLSTLLATKQYGSIYLMFGLNELGWESYDAFASSYGILVDDIKIRQPDALIYAHLIIPVTADKSGSPAYISNERIALYNGLISSMCAEKGIYFLDLSAVMCEAGGALNEAYATDGIQFNMDGTTIWYNYLKNHTVSKEKYRN